jgi:hypothetical protein
MAEPTAEDRARFEIVERAARARQLRDDLLARVAKLTTGVDEILAGTDPLLFDKVVIVDAIEAMTAAMRALDGADSVARAAEVWRVWTETVKAILGGASPEGAANVAVVTQAGRSSFGDLGRRFATDDVTDALAESAAAYVKGPRLGRGSRWKKILTDRVALPVGLGEDTWRDFERPKSSRILD